MSQAVECPLCNQPFEPPTPKHFDAATASGRTFHFQCLRCGSVLEARASQSGHRGKCPTCAALFIVPEMDERTGLARHNADPGADGENPTPVHAYAAAGASAPRIIRTEDDILHIECPRCGRRSPVTADNCPACGLPFTMEGATSRAVTQASSSGRVAVIFGCIAVVVSFCPVIGLFPALAAIALGADAWFKKDKKGFGSAEAGIVLGLIACAISVLIFLNMR